MKRLVFVFQVLVIVASIPLISSGDDYWDWNVDRIIGNDTVTIVGNVAITGNLSVTGVPSIGVGTGTFDNVTVTYIEVPRQP